MSSTSHALRQPAADAAILTPARQKRLLAWQISLALPLVACVILFTLPLPVASLWATVSGVLVIALVLVASVTDIIWLKIPNWATYSAVVWAIVINGYASVVGLSDVNEKLGAIGISESLLGALVPFFCMLVIFSVTGGGAGDVKLCAALGAFLGLHHAIDAILYSFIFAGGYALLRAVWVQGPLVIFELLWRSIGHFLCPIWIFPPAAEQKAFLRQPMPLGPSFALGTFVVLFDVSILGL